MRQKYISNRIFCLLSVLFFIAGAHYTASAQVKKSKVNEDYIRDYKDLAITQMKKYKIPASITLAQGILESGAGKSDLAKRSNNHFGIKCHNDWKGEKVYHNDDARNECFRKYKKVSESFEDHSKFLVGKQRYASLFSLKITDYRGWAKGLQNAGYATNKAYANRLIKLIEDYELYQYDKGYSGGKTDSKNTQVSPANNTPKKTYLNKHTPYRTHNLVYVIAQEGDTYEDIAGEFDFKAKDLANWNEVPQGFPLKKGDLVYFQKKKSKADKPYYEHVVQVGESMHSISQLYGIKVKNLYKMNKKDQEYVPTEGDVLKLR
ncbi:glucosaminidase domain-containing protein [Dysgonomonas sp. 25]|uniref:glucosaminidase domain-containing protein n=1 Tax=Dysgonomonas sp. 25 TaxID=2302933 RepID=UPI0013D3101C|nr:glucosaminidase domain-containing protein [Dysgonomonas sp. 25]NDV69732.1 LysM peptidoglycan-binding domain-containing protein [Dysgonomonas sp. 25]